MCWTSYSNTEKHLDSLDQYVGGKIDRVINSCVTEGQLIVARTYCDLLINKYYSWDNLLLTTNKYITKTLIDYRIKTMKYNKFCEEHIEWSHHYDKNSNDIDEKI